MTKNTATNVVIAAAVSRSNAPNAKLIITARVTYSAARLVDGDGREQGTDADHQRHGDQHGVEAGAQGPELRPLGQQDTGRGHPQPRASFHCCRDGREGADHDFTAVSTGSAEAMSV